MWLHGSENSVVDTLTGTVFTYRQTQNRSKYARHECDDFVDMFMVKKAHRK